MFSPPESNPFDRNNPDNWAKLGYSEINKFGLIQEQFTALSEYMLKNIYDTWYTNGVLVELAQALDFEYIDYYQRDEDG